MLSSIYLIDFKRTPKIYFKDKLYKLNLIELSQVQICNTLLVLTIQSLRYEEVTVVDYIIEGTTLEGPHRQVVVKEPLHSMVV